MYSRNDLQTIAIKILCDNSNLWFSQNKLLNILIKQYNVSDINNPKSELFIGHFLFIWEKLLINNNFITTTEYNNQTHIKIKINKNWNNEITISNEELNRIDVNFIDQLKHMIHNPILYKGSKLIEKFLLKISYKPNKYINLYELILDEELLNFTNLNLTEVNNLIINFINSYDELFLNKSEYDTTINYSKSGINKEIHQYLLKKYNKLITIKFFNGVSCGSRSLVLCKVFCVILPIILSIIGYRLNFFL